MTPIPATLSTSASQTAIILTLDRLKGHELTPKETESDLLSLFDVDMQGLSPADITSYLAAIMQRVMAGELDSETAAGDIQELLKVWHEAPSDARLLLDLGAE